MAAHVSPEPVEPRLTVEATSEEAQRFYADSLRLLVLHQIPFMVGGSYALHRFSRIGRRTKDLDVFIHPRDLPRVIETFAAAGYEAAVVQSHWLAKAFCGDDFIDIIFGSGSGNRPVDDLWFVHAADAEILGVPVKVTPCEEMVWSKAFVMERERYDGADVAHLLLGCADHMDWQRLLTRFGSEWRVLLSHLVLFGFIYPGERRRIPAWLMDELLGRLRRELPSAGADNLCQGTLLSITQYKVDVEAWGFRDARVGHRVMPVAEVPFEPDED
jgi:hypothetical protein